jgi:nucleoid-associated protein YgaU
VDARAAYAQVDPQHRNYDQIGSLIADAESALAAGDTGKAIVLANQAKLLAEAAIKEGVQIKTIPAADSYTVKRGDSLWVISGKGDIYGNPYQWPLIYKANRDKIKDADLIYPGQQFKINRAASQAEVDAATNHARTRGAWSLGVTEESDLRYLSR